MAKKQSNPNKNELPNKPVEKKDIPDSKVEAVIRGEDSKITKNDQFSKLTSSLPKEASEKLEKIKIVIDKYKSALLEKFDKYIIGMTLLPPPAQLAQLQKDQGEQKKEPINPDQIGVLVLVDDSDSKKMSKEELRVKLGTIIENLAKENDKNLAPQTVLLSELWQSCYDGKYEFLQLIAVSAPIYDSGMLAAIKISEIHKTMVLQKFERYIVSYVLAGSLTQGKATEKSDIDVFIVIDDTDVKRMTRIELKDKLRAIIIGMGIEAGEMTGIRNKINIQVYILTEFWDSIREANPIIFTFLRDGVPFYDRGIFMPWKQLLQIGKIKPSNEAIELYMSTGDQILKRVKFKIKEIGMEDTFWAILTPSQAALMLYGVPPPTPKETPEIMRDIFVKKEGLLEEEYVQILERNIKVRKDLEHGDMKELSGKEVDSLLADSEKYLKRIDKLFSQIEKTKAKEDLRLLHDKTLRILKDVFIAEELSAPIEAKLAKELEDKFVQTGKLSHDTMNKVKELLKGMKDMASLTKPEIEMLKKSFEVASREISEYIERKRGKELDKIRIKVRYAGKYGEVLVFENAVYITLDVGATQKEIRKATMMEDGTLTGLRKAETTDIEAAISEKKFPKSVFIKEKMLEDLKNIFGSKLEVQVGN